MALEQAGAYILAQSVRFNDYLISYRKRRLSLLERYKPVAGDYPESVGTTWALNFAEVEKTSEAASDLLRVSAFLSPDSIPFELIKLGAPELGPTLSAALADAADDPLVLHDILEPLRRYSLIGQEGDAYSIHRLVQIVLQSNMPSETLKLWIGRMIRAVSLAMPVPEYENWPLCDKLLAHVEACDLLIGEYDNNPDLETPETGMLLDNFGRYLTERARYSEAERLLKRSISIRERCLGPEDPNTAMSLHNLAWLYRLRGQYAEAEPIANRVVAIWEKTAGPENPDTAKGLNNLALLYRDQGQYALAEPLFKRTLAIWEKTLGPEHPNTAWALNNLALIYGDQRQYAQAEQLFISALAVLEKVIGPEHPDTATGLRNLAGLYQAQGRYAEAEPHFQRSLAIDEVVLGLEHPDTARGMHNLARLYCDMRHYSKAEPLLRQALAIRKKTLTPDHPDIAKSLEAYAYLLRVTNRKYDAARLTKRAKEIRANHTRNNRQI